MIDITKLKKQKDWSKTDANSVGSSTMLYAIFALCHAVDQIEQICSDLIDEKDARIIQARNDLDRAREALATVEDCV